MKCSEKNQEHEKSLREWVMTIGEVEKMESETAAPEIWVVTSDLKDDAEGGSFQQIVSRNIKRGILYRFFVPDTPEMRKATGAMLAFKKKSENLKITELSQDYFFLVPVFDLALYNPLKKKGSDRLTLWGIENPEGQLRYCTKVGEPYAEFIVKKLKKHIKD
jgi:hypothetical protein